MKRNYFLVAAAATMLAACADKVTLKEVNFNDGAEVIAFDAYHSKATKAPVTTEIDLTKANGGIGVYAYKFPSNDAGNAPSLAFDNTTKTINVSTVAPGGADDKYTNPVFDNTMVYYNHAITDGDDFHEKFTYDFPRYWDKQMYYAFFAYAPQLTASAGTTNDATKAVWLDVSKGLFTFNQMHKIQRASAATAKAIGTLSIDQYSVSGTSDGNIKDYMLAPCQPNEKWHATDQTTTPYYKEGGTPTDYAKSGITVGFTFSHLLSKLNVKVNAKEEWNSATDGTPAGYYGHEYKGIKSIYIDKLEIENMPALASLATNYLNKCEQKLGTYTNIYDDAFTAQAVVAYDPQYYASALDIVGAGTTANKYKINGDDNLDNPLYILAGGAVSGDGSAASPFTFTSPGAHDIDGYVDQAFTYYVAPNKPNGTDKYVLNLVFYVEYLKEDGGTRLEKFEREIDLSTLNFTEMKPSFVYTINLTISLDQIYVTVEDIAWGNETIIAPVNETVIEL